MCGCPVLVGTMVSLSTSTPGVLCSNCTIHPHIMLVPWCSNYYSTAQIHFIAISTVLSSQLCPIQSKISHICKLIPVRGWLLLILLQGFSMANKSGLLCFLYYVNPDHCVTVSCTQKKLFSKITFQEFRGQ